MTPRPSFPLVQQILAWLVPALGYGDAGFPVVGVSASTLKNARKGARIPNSWMDLVGGALKVLHLSHEPDDGTTLASIGEALRSWDVRVSTLSGGEDLPLPDRLHMLFTLAIPVLGTRLGALAVMMARMSRSPIDEWLWILRPLDRRFFGRVFGAILKRQKPEWTTREAQMEGLAEIVDARTVERWMSGAISVPGSEMIHSLRQVLGPDAEAILRFARALCVLREDLAGRRGKEGWLGREKLDEWTGLVADVGSCIAEMLKQPNALSAQLGDLAVAMRGPQRETFHRFIQIVWPEPWRSCSSTERLAEAIAALADKIDRSDQDWEAAAVLALWYQCIDPHPSTLEVVSVVFQAPMSTTVHAIDWFRLIEGEWQVRSILRHLAEKGEVELSIGGEPRTARTIPPELQERARLLLTRMSRFSRAQGEDNAMDVIRSLFEGFDPRLSEVFGAQPQLPVHHILGSAAEAALPEDVVRRSLPLSLARARRLAGEIEPALDLLKLHPAPPPWVTLYERRDRAETLVAVTHDFLDRIREAVAASEYFLALDPERIIEAYDVCVGSVLRLVDACAECADSGLAGLSSAPEDPESVEHLVLALSIELRLAVARSRLGVEEAWAPFMALEGPLRDIVARFPTHGKAWAWATIFDEIQEIRSDAKAQAVHFGAAAYFKEICTRCVADYEEYTPPEDEPYVDREVCPDCEGSGIRSDPPEAIADEVVRCTCVVLPDHWRPGGG
ncbi:MAG: hypothetical protein IPK80_28075 [Nannocystis sp.]|nr:hypothetical protein [Nannocystis sp.]